MVRTAHYSVENTGSLIAHPPWFWAFLANVHFQLGARQPAHESLDRVRLGQVIICNLFHTPAFKLPIQSNTKRAQGIHHGILSIVGVLLRRSHVSRNRRQSCNQRVQLGMPLEWSQPLAILTLLRKTGRKLVPAMGHPICIQPFNALQSEAVHSMFPLPFLLTVTAGSRCKQWIAWGPPTCLTSSLEVRSSTGFFSWYWASKEARDALLPLSESCRAATISFMDSCCSAMPSKTDLSTGRRELAVVPVGEKIPFLDPSADPAYWKAVLSVAT